MVNHKSKAHYSTVAKILHWLIAALIIVNYFLAQAAQQAQEQETLVKQLALLANHKSLGLTILLLVALRIAWRISHPPPPLPITPSKWQSTAARGAHWALYILMVLIPMSGWVMASTSSYGLSWFNLFEIPRIAERHESLHELSKALHRWLSYMLVCIASAHVAAALYHHVIVKDNTLRRMSSPLSLLVFVTTIVLTVSLTVPQKKDSNSPTVITTSDATEPVNKPSQIQGELPAWNIDYEQSFIRFTAEQAGAQFNGQWPSWSASIQFDKDQEIVLINVIVDVTQVTTDDAERDQTLLQLEWFNTSKHPQAYFELDTARALGDGRYAGIGHTTIKSIRVETPFEFRVKSPAAMTEPNVAEFEDRSILTGKARLDRFTFDLGLGEWSDTTWIGQFVDVEVKVVTR